MMVTNELETIKPTEAQLRARRNRNIAIGIALALFVILVYVASIVRLGPSILNRPM